MRIRETRGIRVASSNAIRVPATTTGNQGTTSPGSGLYTPARASKSLTTSQPPSPAAVVAVTAVAARRPTPAATAPR